METTPLKTVKELLLWAKWRGACGFWVDLLISCDPAMPITVFILAHGTIDAVRFCAINLNNQPLFALVERWAKAEFNFYSASYQERQAARVRFQDGQLTTEEMQALLHKWDEALVVGYKAVAQEFLPLVIALLEEAGLI